MPDQPDQLHAMRHSLAHIMATAVQHLWPEAKFGVGPVVENGFYYDIDLGELKISEEDFDKIETEMRKVIIADQPFERSEMSIDEAIKWAQEAKQPYKEELLNDLRRSGTTVAKDLDAEELGTITEGEAQVGVVSFYKNGDFTDLCRGPHVESTGKTGAFKLLRVGGAYWRGNEKNAQMQRIYGAAFATDKELARHLEMLEMARKRDHRKLGQELDLFIISPLVGSGLPLFTPRGTVLRDELNRYSQEIRKRDGWQNVWTPHIAKKELYEVSGHWAKFGDEWLTVKSSESSDELVMKPMNCPHHQQLYASRPRSYRDLPLKYMETTTDYRDEKAGELMGLARVRSLTQDDSHTFCRPDQIHEVMSKLVEIVGEFYSVLDLPLKVRLSFRDDSDGYLGDQELWDQAQQIIREVVEAAGLEYYVAEGEAAFYGPKIDFMATDAMGRELQVATPQLDFVQPERFGLKYTDEDGKEKTPVMVHFALMGSIERFLAAYIEHTAGKFPVWVAPEQVRLITVNQEDATVEFAGKIHSQAKELGIRLEIDNSNESVGKKIRAAELAKVPYTVVIGEKEITGGEVVPRIRKDMAVMDVPLALGIEQFLKTVANEAKSRVLKTSL
ncbi:MAG TPA: threonine--tRNA ligase [Candidatus Dormibacteraeota bacterium]|nr:threonine--tRNA ligase [Candidatus Dormibacteraeota bacterium]